LIFIYNNNVSYQYYFNIIKCILNIDSINKHYNKPNFSTTNISYKIISLYLLEFVPKYNFHNISIH